MKLLIDTHTFLWFVQDSNQLSPYAKDLIESSANQIYISIASLWEMAIKSSLSKLELPTSFQDFIPHQVLINGIEIIPINPAHLHQLVNLDLHHRDPFDRLIIAQAMVRGIPVITRDNQFESYPIEVIWNESPEVDEPNSNG